MSGTQITPPGWYDDGAGRQRWWDGKEWGPEFVPPPPALRVKPGPNFYGYGAIVAPFAVLLILGLIEVGIVAILIASVVGVALGIIGIYRKGQSKVSSIVALVLWSPVAIVSLMSLLLWAGQSVR